MAVESPADRAAFLSADDFGVEASYRPVAGGASTTIEGIFDNDFLQVEAEHSAAATRSPRFTCRTADLSLEGRKGDQLVINGVTYLVTVVHPDGTGMTVLWLEDA
jgi:hypothetical protein